MREKEALPFKTLKSKFNQSPLSNQIEAARCVLILFGGKVIFLQLLKLSDTKNLYSFFSILYHCSHMKKKYKGQLMLPETKIPEINHYTTPSTHYKLFTKDHKDNELYNKTKRPFL